MRLRHPVLILKSDFTLGRSALCLGCAELTIRRTAVEQAGGGTGSTLRVGMEKPDGTFFVSMLVGHLSASRASASQGGVKLALLDALNSAQRTVAMKIHNGDVLIQRLDERRYAVAVDGVVRYVGSREECERRAAMLAPKNDRAAQDQALVRVARSIG